METTIVVLVCLEVFLLIILFLVFLNGRRIRKDIKELENSVDTSRTYIYEHENFPELPGPVHRYFKHVLKDGQGYINIARIRQSGSLRSRENQKWMPLKAVQYFNAESPAYIWVASAKSSPFFWISAVDKYFNSRASMTIKPFSLFTITKASGEEMEVSSLIRYISEMPWFPTSLLPSEDLKWEPLDDSSATAVVNCGEVTLRVIFYFNKTGEITKVSSEGRFRFSEGEYSKETWTGYFKKYKEINDIKVPTEIEAEWNLKSGDFKYFRANLEKIEYTL